MSSRPRGQLGAIVAAVLLPPLGIWLARGLVPAFWIGTVLTILFWVPGIIFALVVVLAPDLLPRGWAGERLHPAV